MAKGAGLLLKDVDDATRLRVIDIFPAIYSMGCVLLFVVPTYLIFSALMEPGIAYWRNYSYVLLWIIPLIIGLVHCYHVMYGPNKIVTNLGLVIPSLTLFITCSALTANATNLADTYFSIDCDMKSDKEFLQKEWEAAHLLYTTCLNETAHERKVTVPFLAENFRIQDCTEYPAALAKHSKSWGYLSGLEGNSACTGFCIPGEQLWSYGPHKDSCSVSVAGVYKYVVNSNANQAMTISLITLVVDGIVAVVLGPVLKMNGIAF